MAEKQSGQPKGVKKERRVSRFVEKRSDAKRHRLSAARLVLLGEYKEKLTSGRGHNYADSKDCLRLILLLLVAGFIGQVSSSEYAE